MTHLAILVLSITRVRSSNLVLFDMVTHFVALVLSCPLVRSDTVDLSVGVTRLVGLVLLPDVTHSINDKTISGLGSFKSFGSLGRLDSFLWDGPLLIDDSFA